ncbi:uncharacterized protein LOC130898288 [Diorhabda carinulata]|uniref:uncharacterized protein LOC130898288 n=1 Tax=Diorhabda carinulata TaxID=1163345 RepID=UPI0025A257E8|nr:uncharacterized protein LOC130898288 [Diorhabda carinulata]
MIANIENSDIQNENNTGPREFTVVVKIINVIIVAVFLLPLAEYLLIMKSDNNQIESVETEIVKGSREVIVDTRVETKEYTGNNENSQLGKTKQKSYELILWEKIVKELIEESELCFPNDFYAKKKDKMINQKTKKYIKTTNKERREVPVPPIVNYAIGAILVVLLAAALLELYKAKSQPVKKDGKNSLSRKCSLADLTVMKHHRKEMLRRDSILEAAEENICSKQLGYKPAPLYRQYSFPVGPSSLPIMGTSNHNGRRLSIQGAMRYVPVVDGRPAAVLQGRRHSIISDGKQPLIAVESDRSLSVERGILLTDRIVDDSLERRYYGHGRRVHRH